MPPGSDWREPVLRHLCPAAMLGVVAATLGCAAPSPMVEVADLAAVVPVAHVQVEESSIELGTAAARKLMLAGWWRSEVDRRSAEPFVWSRGERSRLGFFLAWPRDLELELRCRPFIFEGSPPQVVTVLLNGSQIGSLDLRPGFRSYTLAMPAKDELVGRNILEFRYRYQRSPAQVRKAVNDHRELAVAWQRVAFAGPGMGHGERPSTANLRGTLALPLASRADFFLQLPNDSVLAVDRLEGAEEAVLSLSVLADDGTAAELQLPSNPRDGFRVPLGTKDGLVRLRFHVAPAAAASRGELRLVRPRVVAPPQAVAATEPPRELLWETPVGARPPNLVIYLIDALRADSLGCYGAARQLSPRIDGFAREGIVFEQAFAQSSWTRASVASIMTGLRPPEHGVNGPDDMLPEAIPLLSEQLAAAGYETAAFVANAHVNRPFGFARGFATFRFFPSGEGESESLTRQAAGWLDRRGDGPFFLFVHAIDPHAPYAAPLRFRERHAPAVEDPAVGEASAVRRLVTGATVATDTLRRELKALYDAEVAHNDDSFGAFLDLLEARDLADDTAILLVADHGEAFGEHGSWTHGIDLHNEVLHVPLILRLPGGQGGGQRVAELVQHIDILPTLLWLAGVETPGGAADARQLLAGGTESRGVISYLDYWAHRGASVISGRWKYIEPLSEDFGSAPMLFDRLNDPAEEHDLAAARPVVSGYMSSLLRGRLQVRRVSEQAPVDDATRQELRALGYVD